MGLVTVGIIVLLPLMLIGFLFKGRSGSPARDLKKAFVDAGDLKGKTKEEIIAFAGNPTASVPPQAASPFCSGSRHLRVALSILLCCSTRQVRWKRSHINIPAFEAIQFRIFENM